MWWLACSIAVVGACGFSARLPGAPPDGDAGGDAPDAVTSAGCRAVEIEAMAAQTCVRRDDGEVWCWGRNEDGAIGVPSTSTCTSGDDCVRVPAKVTLPEPIAELGLGDRHSCALSATNAYCWGANERGQFGNGTTTSTTSPVEVMTRNGATQLRGGDVHTCSLNATVVACSGRNQHGELGDSTTAQKETAAPAILVGAPAAIGAGFHHSCAVVGGAVHCWGQNQAGQVGGTGSPIATPRAVADVANATAVAGGFAHTCARIMDGSLRCWGANNAGQLGVGDTAPHTGVVTPTISGVTQIALGVDHTCALAGTGVWCWGERYPAGPTQINFAGMGAIAVAAGSYHDCAILADGTVRCWGVNSYGQLGDDSTQDSATPVQAVVCP